MVLAFFEKVKDILSAGNPGVLMLVVANEGSSPGRKGFKMLVTEHELAGTIGGGFMEHKLVELSRRLLRDGSFQPFYKRQVHRRDAEADKSGMNCSGEQTVAFFPLGNSDLQWIDALLETKSGRMIYDSYHGISHQPQTESRDFLIELADETTFSFSEPVQPKNTVFVIGGGHVSQALCEILAKLDVEIQVFDDRPGLNTLEENTFAHEKQIVGYKEIEQFIPEGDHVFVVVMTFGFNTDIVVLERLMPKKVRFIGVMGSAKKVAVIRESLRNAGISEQDLARLHAPIGLPIKSETPFEIAISIAAQLIAVKNEPLHERKAT